MTVPLRLAARTSPLARAQVDLVAQLLAARGVPCNFVGVTTRGDVDRRELTVIGGTGVFVSAVREALREGIADVAVHSLKDLPTASEPDLEVAAVPAREDSRDVLVGCRLADLRDGVRIGTGAPRRALQLLDHAGSQGYALELVPVRGNVGTRLGLVRSGTVDAVVLAAAGLRRLGYLAPQLPEQELTVAGLPAEVLSMAVMLPAPGQGALALEVSRGLPAELIEVVRSLDDPIARAEALTERSFLAALEAGCTAPVGARAVVKSVRDNGFDLTLDAVIGRTLLSNLSEPTKTGAPIRTRWHKCTSDPAQFGLEAARDVLAKLLEQTTRSSR